MEKPLDCPTLALRPPPGLEAGPAELEPGPARLKRLDGKLPHPPFQSLLQPQVQSLLLFRDIKSSLQLDSSPPRFFNFDFLPKNPGPFPT